MGPEQHQSGGQGQAEARRQPEQRVGLTLAQNVALHDGLIEAHLLNHGHESEDRGRRRYETEIGRVQEPAEQRRADEHESDAANLSHAGIGDAFRGGWAFCRDVHLQSSGPPVVGPTSPSRRNALAVGLGAVASPVPAGEDPFDRGGLYEP